MWYHLMMCTQCTSGIHLRDLKVFSLVPEADISPYCLKLYISALSLLLNMQVQREMSLLLIQNWF